MFSIFGVISLFYLYRAVQLGAKIWKDWGAFVAEPFRPQDRAWAKDAAFLIAIPPSVVVHELFHALVVWGLGGKIVDFGFYFYAGFVLPDRGFPPAQSWWISTAGTVGSLLFGMVVYLVLRNNRSTTLRYYARQVLSIIIATALIGYPLLTMGGVNGDWRVIYDFARTPILSGIAGVVHAGILIAYWVNMRRGWGEMPAFSTMPAQTSFRQLQQQLKQNPQNSELQNQHLVQLVQGGANRSATIAVKRMVEKNPRDPNTLFLQGILQRQNSGQATRQSADTMKQALDLGLSDPISRSQAWTYIGELHFSLEQYDEALHVYDQALASAKQAKWKPSFLPQLYFRHAQVQHRRQNTQAALQDIDLAIEQANELAQSKQAIDQFEHFRQQLL